MSSRYLQVAVIAACSVVLAACGSDPSSTAPAETPPQSSESGSSPPAPTTTGSPTQPPVSEPADEAVVVDITVANGAVTPAGDRISVDRGEVVELVVTSDVVGELHVHSSPESYEGFSAGANEPIALKYDRPGLIDIELHEPFEGPVVQLEVS